MLRGTAGQYPAHPVYTFYALPVADCILQNADKNSDNTFPVWTHWHLFVLDTASLLYLPINPQDCSDKTSSAGFYMWCCGSDDFPHTNSIHATIFPSPDSLFYIWRAVPSRQTLFSLGL